MTALNKISFTDLVVSPEAAWIKCSSGINLENNNIDGLVLLSSEFNDDINKIRKLINENEGSKYYSIKYDNMFFRGSRRIGIDGEWNFLRRPITTEIPTLKKLGYNNDIISTLLNKNFNRGGLLFIGEPGSGKTTSASSWVSERLNVFGGLAVALENPPELPLHGTHGNGVCVQIPVDSGDYAQACAQVLRDGAASIIMLGEILEPQTAIQYARTCLIGKTAVSTVHGPSISLGIERLSDMVSSANFGDRRGSNSLIADSLSIVIYQRLEEKATGGKRIRAELLTMTLEARSYIREGNFNLLAGEVERQGASKAVGDQSFGK